MTAAGHADEFAPEDSFDLANLEPRSRIHAYTNTGSGVHAIGIEKALELFNRPSGDPSSSLLWIDVAHPGPVEADFLRDRLKFHPLAVEDCVRGRQRPKLDRYPGYYFLVLYAARVNDERKRMALNELHMFLGGSYIVTVHDHKVNEFSEVLARWRANAGWCQHVGDIAHAIIDSVIDDYFPILDHFSERVEEVEASVFQGLQERNMQDVLALRRELSLFRKTVGPQRDMLSTLLRRDIPFLRPELVPYFQDVHDHALRVTEEIDSLRDLLAGAIDGQLSMQSHQLNTTMRVMAAWSIILMAMAWIAGIYGMNFDIMPELKWRFGYLWALGGMLAVGSGLLYFFRRRHWL